MSQPQPGSYPPPHQQPGGYPPQQQSGGYPSPQQPGGYPPPAQPGPPYGAEAGQPGYGAPVGPPPKKSSVGKILLIVLAVVVVLCVGGGTALYFATKDKVDEVVDATKTRMTTPETLAGRPKVTDPQLQKAATDMVAEMKKDVPDATSTVGAFYGDPQKQDLVMIGGVSGLIADPKKELADATKGLGSELAVSNFKSIDAGPLGGDAECGDGKAQTVSVGVCVWADRGSVGVLVLYFKSGADLQKEFAAMRGQIEQKN
ncbi:hypothetical protein [Micromonospora sp. NPDC050495]|uniref:hypothetical protein n=1 Tax=Micromonospora sp. NPDC050495 TaxID=3154936 RepID=UPI0033DCC866